MRKHWPILLIFVFTFIFYIPIIINPKYLIGHTNDLSEFFFPIFYFVKKELLLHHQLPFWNNLFFSGTPLLPDPQSPLFYLPNIIFLLFKNINTGFLVSIFIHIFISGISMYYLSISGFTFSKKTSLICSLLYIASPKLSGFINAGHFGLITSWAWLPAIFLFTILFSQKPSFKKALYLSLALSLIFYSHILIFIISVLSCTLLYIYLHIIKKQIVNSYRFSLVGLLTFGFIAISFLPQLFWQNQTTRNLLLNDPNVYPKWISKTEFLKSSISPILFGQSYIQNQDTEKVIALGIFTIILSIIGLLKLKRRNKILIIISTLIIVLISLNNASPLYGFLIKQNWYILFRVSTRFWFLAVFISLFLTGTGLEELFKIKKIKFLVFVMAALAVIELLLTSWTKITIPIVLNPDLAPKEAYEFLSKDKSKFRVFCLNRCLSQKESAIYGLELADGYGTLQQTNYYLESEQLSQSFYRNKYTLSIPPFEIYKYENLQPYSPNLSEFNIKYIISNHFLTDKNLTLIKNIDNYFIYLNQTNKDRSNYPIITYTPNYIRINTSKQNNSSVILSEIYNPDWKAYLNGKEEIVITETPDKTRLVNIKGDTKFVDFIYDPLSFKIGLIITSVTIILSLIKFYEIL